ncbi:hypothetical protein Vadar_003388 [Vaccinium darrowii]|uniref:Uncharacterized protein n=1 Tax=Vaccinium darrowii TaxID=229202 RepID=A0ACB7ZHL2_9ERIC|nr:hypothetical protein Vadar_003388 [Vaccinium darrowii]
MPRKEDFDIINSVRLQALLCSTTLTPWTRGRPGSTAQGGIMSSRKRLRSSDTETSSLPIATPGDHIEEIRRKKFNIGGEPDPKNEDLHNPVNYLSAELYTKDVHFLMELIQNAEDNEYLEGVQLSLEFVITSRDITATGAAATLLVFNNEKGFSPKNIESICSVGRSTKKGFRKRGIGFKCVFLITAQPYIFGNGYQIRFNEEPCLQCHIGYIVPEWVDDNSTLSTIKQIYGSNTSLPTTTVVLPLKPGKVKPVKQQLSRIHPEVLLFLSKIKRLLVKEDNEDLRLNSVSAISISSETNFVTRKNIDAESYMLHLSSNENSDNSERERGYYMWKQRFPVRSENKVEKRTEVEKWVLTLAFPNGERLKRGMNSPGVYAFLPTEMVTNFPFIIQADSLLASSRETILMDNKWNQGILGCVPSAFINAFISLVKTLEDAPISSLPPMFRFLPINESPYPELNAVKEKIKGKIMAENIVPCESYMEQKLFQKPGEVSRLMPAFWNILTTARKQGANLHNISSHGRYELTSSFDRAKYNHILNFLGVKQVEDEWYAKCIRGSNLVMGVSEEGYLELLLFLAEKWRSNFCKTSIINLPLLKYIIMAKKGWDSCPCERKQMGKFASVHTPEKQLINFLKTYLSACDIPNISPPNAVVPTMSAPLTKQNTFLLLDWFRSLKSKRVPMPKKFLTCIKEGRWMRVSQSGSPDYRRPSESFLTDSSWGHLLQNESVLVDIPIIDQNFYGNRICDYKEELRSMGVMFECGEACKFIGKYLMSLASSSTLTNGNVLSMLKFIKFLRDNYLYPQNFTNIVKEERWLRTSIGFRAPVQSVLFDQEWRATSQISDIPFIDEKYYSEEILSFKTELEMLGVVIGFGENYQLVSDTLKSPAHVGALIYESCLLYWNA